MALKIRLARAGTKKRPFYRIVVAEATAPRDGRFVEKVGTYDPRLPSDNLLRVVLKKDRIEHWLSVGAKPTERAALFLAKADIIPAPAQPNRPQKAAPRKKALERKAEKEAKQAEKTKEAAAAQEEAVKKEAVKKTPAEEPSSEAPKETPKDAPAKEPKAEVKEDSKKASPSSEVKSDVKATESVPAKGDTKSGADAGKSESAKK
ncbi:30S ribosomal protein S16 [bacterium NHP-B]|nr:30S ribosomal protein S16 [bacterium NHP-B]